MPKLNVYKGVLKPIVSIGVSSYYLDSDEAGGCCGIVVISGFPYDSYSEWGTESDLVNRIVSSVDYQIRNWDSGYYQVNLTHSQSKAMKLLEEYFGFQLLEEPFINPNTDNKIYILGLCKTRFVED